MDIVAELKWQFAPKDFARLKFTETDSAFSIDMMLVPSSHRGQGVGSELLKNVLILADAKNKVVNLTARPIGAELKKQALDRLVSFYQNFGFRVTETGVTVVYMRREPITQS